MAIQISTGSSMEDRVAEALTALSGVADCAVLERTTEDGVKELVAYIVPSGSFVLDRLESSARATLPAELLPAAYVPLSSLPLTADGRVDRDELRRFPVLDAEVIDRWRGVLAKRAGLGDVAVSLETVVPSARRLHLSDLVPPVAFKPRKLGHAALPEAAPPVMGQRVALADGGPLRQAIPDNLGTMLEETASRCGDRAVIYESGSGPATRQTYSGLLAEARRVAESLRRLGLEPRAKVLLQCDSNRDFLAAFWGAILAGVIPVPASIAPTYKEDNAQVLKLLNVWQMLDSPLVITTRGLQPELSQMAASRGAMLRLSVVDDLRRGAEIAAPCPASPDDPALFLLTSGSTGLPKVVSLTHRNLLSRSAATIEMLGVTDRDVSLNFFPLDHVGGLVMYHVIFVLAGAEQVHVPTEAVLQDPLRWLDLIETHRVTNTWSPNFGFALINARQSELESRRWDLSCLRTIINGGEAIVPDTARRFMELTARHGVPASAMRPSWGMSETSSGITIAQGIQEPKEGFVEVGSAIAGVKLRIVDAEGTVLPEGATGRLQVTGAAVTHGYYLNPDQNAQSFTSDGWFETGDLAMLREGRLTITGRSKDVIIVNGVNFFSHEIEAVVDEVDGVEVSYTAAVPVRLPGDASDRICIAFHPVDPSWNAQLRVIGAIKEAVVRKMGVNPAFVLPVERDAIPKTAIGKIQRSLLRQRFEAGELADIVKRVDVDTASGATVPSWFFKKIWVPRRRSSRRDSTTAALVFVDRHGVTGIAREYARVEGTAWIEVEASDRFERISSDRYRIDPRTPLDYRKLFDSLSHDRRDIDVILHCWTYDDEQRPAHSDAEGVARAQFHGTYSLVNIVQAAADLMAKRDMRLLVVSSHAQSLHDDERVEPGKATMLGLLQTLSLEMPRVDCRHLDLQANDVRADASHLAEELRLTRGAVQVAYRDGRRLEALLQELSFSPAPLDSAPILEEGLYLITGGLGGAGTLLAEYLAQRFGAKLLLVGRTELSESGGSPQLEDAAKVERRRRNFRRLEGGGVDFHYRVADISDPTALRLAVEEAERRWERPLAGIFHLAGEGNTEKHWAVMEDHWIRNESLATFEWMFGPKVYGTINLFNLLATRPEALFVGFSSAFSLFGSATSSAYSAANSFLDAYCRLRRLTTHPRTFCINWSVWHDTGMSEGSPEAVVDAFRGMGYSALTGTNALNSLLGALMRDEHELAIGLDPASPHILQHTFAKPSPLLAVSARYSPPADAVDMVQPFANGVDDRYGVGTVCVLELVDKKSDTEAMARAAHTRLPQTPVEREVARIWQEVLSLASVSLDDRFFELGGDSLLAMRVVNRIRDSFGMTLSLRNLFEMPTVSAMARAVSALHARTSAPESADASEAGISYGQRALLFFQQQAPESPAYNAMLVARLPIEVNTPALRRAFDTIVARHEVLRTRFRRSSAGVSEEVAAEASCDFGLVDAAGWPEEQLDAALREHAAQPYALERESALRVRLFSRGASGPVLLIAIHHIAVDYWSFVLLLDEVKALYTDFIAHRAPSLPQPEAQYGHFARWQTRFVNSAEGEASLKYWRSVLTGDLPLLDVPADRPRPPAQTFAGESYTFSLDEALTRALAAVAQTQGKTLYSVMLTAFYAVLTRYTGQRDIIVGSPMAARSARRYESAIGYFANIVPLRMQIEAGETYARLLTQVSDRVLEASDHQDYPFPLLVEKLALSRDPSRPPVCNVLFSWEKSHLRNNTGHALDFESVEIEQLGSPQDLILMCFERDTVGATFLYNTDLFTRATIERISRHFINVLKHVAGDPDVLIDQIPLLDETDLRQMLSWNETRSEYPRDVSIAMLFEEQVERAPYAIAIRSDAGLVSYDELNRRANKVAHWLRKRGVGPDVMVGVCIERSVEALVGVVGILKAGGAYVPLDPSYPAERLELMIQDTEPPVLLTQAALDGVVAGLNGHKLCVDSEWSQLDGESDENPPTGSTAENLAYVIYTSGSTGRPKGVCVPQRAVVRLVRNTEFMRFGPDEVFLQAAPLSFDASTLEIWGPLLNGGSVAVLAVRTPSLEEIGTALRTHQVTTAWMTAGLFHLMVDQRPGDLAGLRQLLAGGDVLSPAHVSRAMKALSDGRVINGYGPTENTTFTCCHTFTDEPTGPVPVGRPIANTQVYVLDANRRLVPIGVPGELYAAGDGLARGYLKRPELTAEKFVANPFSDDPSARLYRTGDLVRYRADGVIEFLGRLDEQVKVRGFRIELGEIESVLRTHDDVQECAVTVFEPSAGDKRLVAHIAGRTKPGPDGPALRSFLQSRLPEYMVPHFFIAVDQLPLSPNGKVDRQKLPRPEARVDAAVSSALPDTDVERRIAAIWQRALKVGHIGRNENFFELGGHSLLLVEVHGQLCDVLGKDVSVVDLFRYPTIGSLAAFLGDRETKRDFSDAQERARKQKAAIGRRQTRSRGGLSERA